MTGQEPSAQHAQGARRACDVMVFGQEIGRVLSDGRVVGRAEPFAKVFPSSRGVKRAVGLLAWGVLEDIALDARLDDHGRLVAETNVRRIAANLGMSKTTVQKHLAVLRDFGFVLHEESREVGSGRYEQVRYVIDPSACIERFTTALGPRSRPAGGGRAAAQGRSEPVAARVPDSGTRSVSQFTGHGDLVQQTEVQDAVDAQAQQPPVPEGDEADRTQLVAHLTAVDVAPSVAPGLVEEHPTKLISDVLEAVGAKRLHNPAGWLVRAISGRWDLSDEIAEVRAARARARARERDAAAGVEQRQRERDQQERSEAWAAAVSAALDDRQLAEAVRRLTRPLPGVGRRSAPAACAALVRWAQSVAATHPGRPLDDALQSALAAHPTPDDVPDAPPDVAPPAPGRAAAALSTRVAAQLEQDAHRSTPSLHEPSL